MTIGEQTFNFKETEVLWWVNGKWVDILPAIIELDTDGTMIDRIDEIMEQNEQDRIDDGDQDFKYEIKTEK